MSRPGRRLARIATIPQGRAAELPLSPRTESPPLGVASHILCAEVPFARPGHRCAGAESAAGWAGGGGLGLFAGVFLTPGLYIAIRYSLSLRGYARRHPFKAVLGAAAGGALAAQALRLLTHLAD